MALGRLQPSGQFYQASGEATPQAQLPEQFVSNPVPPSPISGHLTVAYESYRDIRRAPVVNRVPRLNGMRTLYARPTERMPVSREGADGIPRPFVSGFQTHDMGPIRNGHFNDALYQAGYPGFNLGLSFRVPVLPTKVAQTRAVSATPANINVSRNPPILRRSSGANSAGGTQE